MTRDEVTQLILTSKRSKQLHWSQLAEATGQSKEWTTAALLGQMSLQPEQTSQVGALLELPAEAVSLL
jgi:cyanate lyase